MESKETVDEDVKKKISSFFFSSLLRLEIPSVYFSSSSFSFCRPEKVVTLFFSRSRSLSRALSVSLSFNYLASSSFSIYCRVKFLYRRWEILLGSFFVCQTKKEREEEDAATAAVLARSHPDWTICFSLFFLFT
jgi:hypothetical protein